MEQVLRVQIAAICLVLGLLAVGELVQMLLALAPGSEFVWYLNNELFRPFVLIRTSNSLFGSLFGLPAPLLTAAIGIVLALLLCRRNRLGIAVMSNGCALFAADLAYHWFVGTPGVRTAALVGVVTTGGLDASLVVLLSTISGVAFAASHISYLYSARAR